MSRTPLSDGRSAQEAVALGLSCAANKHPMTFRIVREYSALKATIPWFIVALSYCYHDNISRE
jgi:hypothetical protein